MDASQDLSRRERQIMEVVYARGDAGATAEEVVEGLTDPPTRTAVRTFLRMLEDRGLLKHDKRGRAFVYRPAVDERQARQRALKHLVARLFNGSPSLLVLNVLEDEAIDRTELKRLKKLIRDA